MNKMPTPCPPRRRLAAAMAMAALATACGGGGGSTPDGEPSTGMPAAPTAVLAATPADATALVRLAEQKTRELRLAAGVSAVPQAAGGGTVHIQAVRDESASLCSTGSLSVTVDDALLARFETDPNAQMRAGDAIAVDAAACVVKAPLALGDVALGDFGVGARIDGSFRLLLEQRSGNDHMFALTYTAFSYTPVGASTFEPLNAVLRFGSVAGTDRYTLDLNDTRLLQAPVVSAVGNTIAVGSARLRTALASGQHVDMGYSDWVLDAAALRASAGSVQVQGAGNTLATITAGTTGYRVDFRIGGVDSGFDVPR